MLRVLSKLVNIVHVLSSLFCDWDLIPDLCQVRHIWKFKSWHFMMTKDTRLRKKREMLGDMRWIAENSLVKIWMYRELNGIERFTCQLFTLSYDDKHTKSYKNALSKNCFCSILFSVSHIYRLILLD